MNQYEAKQEARRERLEAAAANARKQSNSLFTSAKRMAEAIPFGQPILVGHHSERRDRNYRAKIHNNFGRAFEADKRAKELAARAEAVGSAGISSDDPDAVDKLSEKLAGLEKVQAQMRAANAAIRKHRKAGAETQVAALVKLGLSEAIATKLLSPDFCGRIGFADYQLTNNNANIRRIKQRIAQLSAQAARFESANAPKSEEQHGEVRLVRNLEENRLQLIFPGKPSTEIRSLLKGRGFRWSPMAGAWQRQLNNAAEWAAEVVLKSVANGGAA